MIRTLPFLFVLVAGLSFWAGWRACATHIAVPKTVEERALICGCRHHRSFHHRGTDWCDYPACRCQHYVSLNAVEVPNVVPE